jgi:hypothetical protein
VRRLLIALAASVLLAAPAPSSAYSSATTRALAVAEQAFGVPCNGRFELDWGDLSDYGPQTVGATLLRWFPDGSCRALIVIDRRHALNLRAGGWGGWATYCAWVGHELRNATGLPEGGPPGDIANHDIPDHWPPCDQADRRPL